MPPEDAIERIWLSGSDQCQPQDNRAQHIVCLPLAFASGCVSAINESAYGPFCPVLRIDVFASTGAGAAHLSDNILFDFDVMRHIRGLGVEAAGRQHPQTGGDE